MSYRVTRKVGGGGGCCDTCSCNCVASGCCPDCVAGRARSMTRTLGNVGELVQRVPWGVVGGLAAVWYLLKK